jgi:hypothetical protein
VVVPFNINNQAMQDDGYHNLAKSINMILAALDVNLKIAEALEGSFQDINAVLRPYTKVRNYTIKKCIFIIG